MEDYQLCEKITDSNRWIFELKEKTFGFINSLKGNKLPGFYRYSFSSDIFNEDTFWGLGNTVFAIKILFTLGKLDQLGDIEKNNMADFIGRFQHPDGSFCDSLVKKESFFSDKMSALKNLDFNNFFHKFAIKAETRQTISALELLGLKPKIPYSDFPKNKLEINKFINSLDWSRPWGAGSHFSHLLFFISRSNLADKEDLIDYSISSINSFQSPKDGSWYKKNPSVRQKINGAMKIITGLNAAKRLNFNYAEKLVDMCLAAQNDCHACDNFNIIYVLKYSNALLKGAYRSAEIKTFVEKRLLIYKQYYFPQYGGFSFSPKKANEIYYGAKITTGKNEPDIHGTVMFLWGISLIAQMLEINDELQFNEFVT